MKEKYTLYINLSNSRCGNCGKECDPNETRHIRECGYHAKEGNKDGCGVKWRYVSSDYFNMDESLIRMRPDLKLISTMFGSRAKKI